MTLKNDIILSKKGTHNHPDSRYEIKALHCLQEIKRRTLEDIMTPVPTIYREETSKEIFPEQVNELIPSFKTLQRTLYRIRSSVLPPLPQSVAEIRIDGQWSQTVDGRNFLLCDSGTGSDRIIIFGTNENLQILCEAERIFMDGTFKIVPALFHQLYTIHCKYKGQVFPMIFSLLQSQSQFHYESMWRLINQAARNRGLVLNVNAAISDFEVSAINAVQTIFPAADMKACYFHYSQSVMRKVQSIGLRGLYRTDQNVKKWIKKLSILPLVPPSLVGDAFILIQEEAPQDARAETLENYMVETYLEDDIYHPSLFPKSLWNHFDNEGERTTNHVESWHSKMNRRTKLRHPNIFIFIHILKNEQKENECSRRMLDAGHPPPGSTRKHIIKNEMLARLKLQLINNEINLADYLESAVTFSPLR